VAWATTLHKFQGFEAGPGKDDVVKHLIIDPGDLKFEMGTPGLLYVALSRGKTFGDFGNGSENYNSSVYWTGADMCLHRIIKIGKKQNGEISVKLENRTKWVAHLEEIFENTRITYNEELIESIKETSHAEWRRQQHRGILGKDRTTRMIHDTLSQPRFSKVIEVQTSYI